MNFEERLIHRLHGIVIELEAKGQKLLAEFFREQIEKIREKGAQK